MINPNFIPKLGPDKLSFLYCPLFYSLILAKCAHHSQDKYLLFSLKAWGKSEICDKVQSLLWQSLLIPQNFAYYSQLFPSYLLFLNYSEHNLSWPIPSPPFLSLYQESMDIVKTLSLQSFFQSIGTIVTHSTEMMVPCQLDTSHCSPSVELRT